MRLLPQLLENRLGDIVVGAPVRSSFSVGELIHVMPTQLARQAFGFAIDLSSRVHQMYLSAVKLNGRDLFPGGAFGNDGNKGQAYQPCEISFGHGRGARGGLVHGTVRRQQAIKKSIPEGGSSEAIITTAGRVGG